MKAEMVENDFLLGLFDPEDGGDMFLRNVGLLSTDYMTFSLFVNSVLRTSNPMRDYTG
jgi:hypothetical protein